MEGHMVRVRVTTPRPYKWISDITNYRSQTARNRKLALTLTLTGTLVITFILTRTGTLVITFILTLTGSCALDGNR